MSGYLGH